MSPLIKKYYTRWIKRPTLFGVGGDVECFYKFVKACIRYSRNDRKDGQWLRYFLEKDICSWDEIAKAVSLFDHLMDYHETGFPDPMVEMKNPYMVKSRLERYQNFDGTPKYTDKEIDEYLKNKFGMDWNNNYRSKYGLRNK